MHASTQGEGEFTVECNPETVTPELMTILRSGGVNRVSIGAQTFNPVHLKTLERWHDPDNVPKALDLARAAGIARQSIDLIYAIPGQSLADLERDLAHALSLGTTHLSAYSLTYEPNTAMTARKNRGEFAPVDEDLDADMAQLVLTKLRAAGLDRYEISNFAVPGAESRHNLAYWRQEPWLACGPSASGHFAGHRWKNLPRLDDYLAFDDEGFTAARDHEPPDPRRALSERVMTGLRLREGLPLSEIEPAARALGLWPALERAAQRLASRGQLLVDSGERWRLTDEAMMLADGLALELMSALDPA
jgi:oxygen-independent coproporphyrinogen-3 oxidase